MCVGVGVCACVFVFMCVFVDRLMKEVNLKMLQPQKFSSMNGLHYIAMVCRIT